MNIELFPLFLIILVVLTASYIQSVTGFGFGIFAMIFLPHILTYTEANVLSSILSAFTSITVVAVMLRKTHWKNTLFPLIGFSLSSYYAVNFIKAQNNDFLTLLLGIALFSLSIYLFFFSKKIIIKPTWYAGLIAGVLSGVLGGMFSISGPPVVIYFLQSEKDSDHYLATLSMYFVLSGIVSIGMKIAAGFVTGNVCAGLFAGTFSMILGSFIGRLTRSKASPMAIRRAVYTVMALSGVLNICSVLF